MAADVCSRRLASSCKFLARNEYHDREQLLAGFTNWEHDCPNTYLVIDYFFAIESVSSHRIDLLDANNVKYQPSAITTHELLIAAAAPKSTSTVAAEESRVEPWSLEVQK